MYINFFPTENFCLRVARGGTVPVPIGSYKVFRGPSFPLSRWGPVWVAFQWFEGFSLALDQPTRAAVLYWPNRSDVTNVTTFVAILNLPKSRWLARDLDDRNACWWFQRADTECLHDADSQALTSVRKSCAISTTILSRPIIFAWKRGKITLRDDERNPILSSVAGEDQ